MVKAEALTRYYGTRLALDEVSFTIGSGEIVGILGLNGAGKSTLLRILAGLLMPSSGRAEVDEVDVVEARTDARRRVGFLPEDPPLYREMTVEAFLTFTGQLKGLSRAEVEAVLPKVCDRTGLSRADRRRVIEELSHGYRKRVGIAQAILHAPSLVILDEPISGLDPRQIVDMRETIAALRGQHTVLVSSHILSEISQSCDRILLIHEGRLVAEGTEASLTDRLTGGTCYALSILGEVEALDAFLAAHGDVAQRQLSAAGGGVVETSLVLATPPERLIKDLVEAGFGVRRVAEEQSELEQVFLDLTRSKNVPEAA